MSIDRYVICVLLVIYEKVYWCYKVKRGNCRSKLNI